MYVLVPIPGYTVPTDLTGYVPIDVGSVPVDVSGMCPGDVLPDVWPGYSVALVPVTAIHPDYLPGQSLWIHRVTRVMENRDTPGVWGASGDGWMCVYPM